MLMTNLKKKLLSSNFKCIFLLATIGNGQDLWYSPLAVSAFLWEFTLFLGYIYSFCWWTGGEFLTFFWLIRKFMLRIRIYASPILNTHTPNLIGQFTPWAIPVNLVYYIVITTLKAKIIWNVFVVLIFSSLRHWPVSFLWVLIVSTTEENMNQMSDFS